MGMYAPERKFGGKIEDRWAKDESLLLTVAEECVELVYETFGGRAHDLVACVDCLLFHNDLVGGLEDKLRAAKNLKFQKEIFMEAATGFPDFAASIRWLEMTLDPAMLSQTIDISSCLENWAPMWTFEEDVAVFDALVVSAKPFLVYQDAVDILFKLRPHSRSEAQLVLRSLILHRVIAY
ncbi:UNVERIFIED_CONTAM: hypothetical protein HDU68_004413 [Siphonaria sp. JEL0065]|nr:hypothetical protein HDU68_004413 [Siphonaria sp. JEL0065]